MNFSLNILFLLQLTTISAIASDKTLHIYLEDFPPYNYIDAGDIKGINTELVQYVCEATQTTCQFTLLPWARALHLTLQEPDSGLYSTGMSAQRQSLFKWVGPLVSSQTTIYKLKHRKDIVFSNVNKLKGYSIAVVRKTVSQQMILEHGLVNADDFIEFGYLSEYIPLFFAGKIDLIPGSSITSPYHLPKLGYRFEDLEVMATIDDQALGNYLAFNTSVSDELVQRMNVALAKYRDEGHVEQVIQRYSPFKKAD